MAEAFLSDWSKWIKGRMSALNMRVNSLSRKTAIPEATLRSYRAGKRKPSTSDKRKALAKALKLTNETIQDAEQSLADSLSRPADTRDFYQLLDSPEGSLRTMTLAYGPFANGANLFIDQFFERFCRLSVIRRIVVGADMKFALSKRLEMLYLGRYDVATNLLGTLPRLKKLKFYWFPIRVSIGAVCLRANARQVQEVARSLALRKPDPRNLGKLWPIVIPSEVGAIHVQQSLGMRLEHKAHFVDDLDPKKLAAQLKEQSAVPDRLACTVTDELTALAVARELGREALVVFPLTTALSVQTSPLRRELPAHVLGAAVSRRNKNLCEYLDDAWAAMLRWEPESTSTHYTTLFEHLSRYVSDCLLDGPLVSDTSGGVVDLRRLEDERKNLFIYRTSRAYAKRALQLDRRSIEYHAYSSSQWQSILERTREKVLMQEAADRLLIRSRVLLVVSEAIGPDYLREEKPAMLSEAHLLSLVPLLEQEFDLPLSGNTAVESLAKASTIEQLTSYIQHAMERSSVISIHTSIRDEAGPVLGELRLELAHELAENGVLQPDGPTEESTRRSLVATYRGKVAGCVDMDEIASDGTCQLRNLFVRPPFRKLGVGRLLIRGAIEHVSNWPTEAPRSARISSLTIDLARIPYRPNSEDTETFFERNGFRRRGNGDLLAYTLL